MMPLEVDQKLHQVINDIQTIVCGLENLKRSNLTELELHNEINNLLKVAFGAGALLHESRRRLFLLAHT